MKKALTLVLAVCMVFAFAACTASLDEETSARLDSISERLAVLEARVESDTAQGDAPEQTTPEDVAEAVGTVWKDKLDAGEEVLIGIIAPAFDNESTINITDTLTETVEAIGCTVSAVSAEMDNANCISAIENFITQGAAAVCIFPMDSALLEDVVSKAEDAGTMIFFFGEKPGYYVDGGVISDNVLTGQAVAQMGMSWAKERFPDHEKIGVFIGGCLSNEMNADFQNSVRETVEADDVCYVGYLNTSPDSLTVDGGFTLAENALTADPDIRVFLCMKPDVAVGIENYLESRSDLDIAEFGIFTADANQAVAEMVMGDGSAAVRGLIPFGTDNVGYDLGNVIVDIIHGTKTVPYWAALELDTLNNFGWTFED